MSESLNKFAQDCAAYITKDSSNTAIQAITKHIDASVPHPKQNAEVRMKIDSLLKKQYFSKSAKSSSAKPSTAKPSSAKPSTAKSSAAKPTSRKRKAEDDAAKPISQKRKANEGAAAAAAAIAGARELDPDDLDDFVEYDTDEDPYESDYEDDDDEDDDDDGDVEMEGDDLFDIAKYRKQGKVDVEAADAAFQEWKRNRPRQKTLMNYSDAFEEVPEINEDAFLRSRIKLTENLILRQKAKLAEIEADLASGNLTKKETKSVEMLRNNVLCNIKERENEIERFKRSL